ILKVLADSRYISDHWDAVRSQLVRRSDARKEEQLRRADCPGRQDHLPGGACHLGPAVALVTDSHRATLLAKDRKSMGIRLDCKVWPGPRGLQEGDRGAAPHAGADGGLETAESFLGDTVEVAVLRGTKRFAGCIDEQIAHRVYHHIADLKRPPDSVEFV